MDFTDPRTRSVFYEVHSDQPRAGPGDRSSTKHAFSLASPFVPNARVLDIGCGPGMQTVHLAELMPSSNITAIDSQELMVLEARKLVEAQGHAARVRIDVCDMANIPYPSNKFNLIWCEGAAYIMGIERALSDWKRLLSPRGKIAITEVVWLKPDPPKALKDFWTQYPDMNNIENRLALFERCGYRMLGDFVLPESAWWKHYYDPMTDRLDSLRVKYRGDAVAESVISACYDEIDLYRRFSDYYGYTFFVAEKVS